MGLLIGRTLNNVNTSLIINNNGMIFLLICVEHGKKGMGSMIIGWSRVENEEKLFESVPHIFK